MPNSVPDNLQEAVATSEKPARNFLVHLRLPFQLLLAPFTFWGALLAHGRLSLRFAAAFVVLTVCFYGATTAFNSHYDRDEGPIGGLENPPPAGAWLLPGSLALHAAGLLLAWWIHPAFALACAAFAVLGVLYSHPHTRWKGHPWLSWMTVMAGQGALGAVAGATAATGRLPATPEMPWGLLAAALIVGGLYPLSQVYQVEEDSRRGDHTVAMMLGHRTCAACQGLFLLGVCAFMNVLRVSGRPPAEVFAVGVVMIAALLVGSAWVCLAAAPKVVFRRVLRFQALCASGFALYTVLRLVLS